MGVSEIVKEIKKERLSRHFDEVDQLTRSFQPELQAPPPFYATEKEPWPAVYRRKVEQDSNANHMLRKHLHSRAFWKNHTDWERELEAICLEGGKLLRVTAADYLKGLVKEEKKIRPTTLFDRTAIEDAFNECVGMTVNGRYELRREGGVIYRGHLVEETSAPGDFEEVKGAHRILVNNLKTGFQMSEVENRWKAVKSHQQSMDKILSGVLLAGDIVYPCRFCRSYFKD